MVSKLLKRMFQKPSPDAMAEQMLHDAQVALLFSQSAKEHWDAEVAKLRLTIARLEQRRRELAKIEMQQINNQIDSNLTVVK